MKVDFHDFYPVTKRYAKHRAGFYLVAKLINLNFNLPNANHPNSILCVLELDANYVWGEKNIPKQYTQPWIGFLHLPINIPTFLSKKMGLRTIVNQAKLFKIQEDLCKGLICLSQYHASFLENIFFQYNINIPIFSIKHPTITPNVDEKWSLKKFLNNQNRKIIQIGWFLRKVFSIYLLPYSNLFNKAILKPILNDSNQEQFIENLEIEKQYAFQHNLEIYPIVEEIQNLTNHEYDLLLSNNIIFVEYYDLSASNTIIECIARGTPIIVNKHPALIEYLGEDYCLFFNSYEDAIFKAENPFLLLTAHKQLLNKANLITETKFIQDFQSILNQIKL